MEKTRESTQSGHRRVTPKKGGKVWLAGNTEGCEDHWTKNDKIWTQDIVTIPESHQECRA